LASSQQTDIQQQTLSVGRFLDRRGNPTQAPAGTTFSWLVDNDQLLSLSPSDDGRSCLVKSVGPLGIGTVSLFVNDGQGNPLASGAFELEVIGSAPVSVEINPGTPEDQTTPMLRHKTQKRS
jgi:hypothetical protein